jgi:hypothetical protein
MEGWDRNERLVEVARYFHVHPAWAAALVGWLVIVVVPFSNPSDHGMAEQSSDVLLHCHVVGWGHTHESVTPTRTVPLYLYLLLALVSVSQSSCVQLGLLLAPPLNSIHGDASSLVLFTVSF